MIIKKLFILALIFSLFGCINQIKIEDKGSYKGSYYVVQKGDTIYFISLLADKDVNEIIRYNHLKPPYTITPGQKINLWHPVYTPPSYGGTGAGDSYVASVPTSTTKVVGEKSQNQVVQSNSKGYVTQESKQNVNNNTTIKAPNNSKIERWIWPTKGRVIGKFALGDQGNKGIDITGKRGQNVVSTANGVIVYAGNALRGYGNLIIVKHNDEYLSAYAHNDRLLVNEGQAVKAGQKIALMGSTGTNDIRLHFEIRYKGKSVNPENYLK